MDEAHGANVVIRDADMHDGTEESNSRPALQVTAVILPES